MRRTHTPGRDGASCSCSARDLLEVVAPLRSFLQETASLAGCKRYLRTRLRHNLKAENANLERARDQDHSSAADALKATRVELETCRKALEDAREVIVERTEDLRAVEKQAETSTRAAASEALAAAVREKTEAIRELEEVSRSRVKEESDCAEAIAVVERKARKKLLTMAEDTAAAKKARARYAADLAIAKEDRGRLEERSKESQATIENLEASLAELQERTLGIEVGGCQEPRVRLNVHVTHRWCDRL